MGEVGLFKIFRSIRENPVYLLEKRFHRDKASTGINYVRIFSLLVYPAILLLPFSIIFILTGGMKNSEFFYEPLPNAFLVPFYIQTLYFCWRAASHSWSLISKERERRRYDNLVSTLMTPAEIVKGKFMASFLPLAIELTVFMPIFAGISFFCGINELTTTILGVYLFTLLFIAFFTTLGLYFSSRSRNTIKARNFTIRALVFMFIGLPILLLIISFVYAQIFPLDYGIHYLIENIVCGLVLAANPIVNMWAVCDFFVRLPVYRDEFASFNLLFSIPFYITTGLILYRLTKRNVEEISNK